MSSHVASDASPAPVAGTVVVGVDGSAAALQAMRWAATEAAILGVPLRIVNVWTTPVSLWSGPLYGYMDPVELAEGSERIVDRARRTLERELGDQAPVMELRSLNGNPAHELLKESEGSGLVVVGNRGRGEVTGLILGSVSSGCAHHTTIPLVIIGTDHAVGSGRIVVGIDGSPGSLDALRWAAREANLHETELEVVHGWEMPAVSPPGGPVFEPLADHGAPGAATRFVERLTDEALGDGPRPQVMKVRVVGAPPVQALMDAAAGAALLVVGTRGRGGFTGLVLGSVSRRCIHHSPCPVAVIPPVTLPEHDTPRTQTS